MSGRPVLTRHALFQMERRGISHDEVFQVLDFPDVSVPSRRDPLARKLWKTVNGRRIAAIVGPSRMGGESVRTVYALDEEDQ